MPRILLALLTLLLLAAPALAHNAAYPQSTPAPAQHAPSGKIPLPPMTAVTPQIVAPVMPPSPQATAKDLEIEADQLRAEKMFVDSIEYYRAALDKTPLKATDKQAEAAQRAQAALLFNKMGIAQLQLQRFNEARRSFERSIKLNKAYADAYNNLGVVWYLRKNFGRAIREYGKSLKMNEALASTHNNLATAYFERKDYDKAMVEYQRALQLDPDILERNSRVGVAARMSSPRDQAEYQYRMARLFAQLKDSDKCLRYLEKAIEAGYPNLKQIDKDEAFAGLRQDPRFEALLARAKTLKE